MRTVSKYLLAATLAVAFVASADAQGQRRGGGAGGGQPPGGGRGQGGGMFGGAPGLMQLVVNKSVLDEIKVTDEQKEKLAAWAREAGPKMMEKMQELRGGGDQPDFAKIQEAMAKINKEQMEEVSKVLKEEQTKRLKQIQIQTQSVGAFRSKDVQDGLKLTDEQKETVREILAAMQTEQRELFPRPMQGERPTAEQQAETTKKRAEFNKKYLEKISAQLKDDQKKLWEDMTGKAFEYKPEAPRRRDN